METKEIKNSQSQPKRKDGVKKAASYAAAMAAGGVAGATGSEFLHEEDIPVVDVVEPTTDNPDTPDNPPQPQPGPSNTPENHPTEQEPVTASTETGHATPTPQPTHGGDVVEPVDPDKIAEAVISGEEIDPNDINMADVVNFEEIGTVYDVSGNEYTAASFHDINGGEYVMVDVDNDAIFDEIYDSDGNYVAEANGLSVGDAEIEVNGEGYLAQTDVEVEHYDDLNGDAYLSDITEV
jgi:hypothetical protein